MRISQPIPAPTYSTSMSLLILASITFPAPQFGAINAVAPKILFPRFDCWYMFARNG